MLYDQYFIDDLKDRADLVRRTLLVIASIAVFTFTAIGQNKQAVLVTEFGQIPCDHFLMQLDIFVQGLRDNPNDKAIAVVYPGHGEQSSNAQLRLILSRFEYAKQEDRLELFVGPKSTSLNTQFWRVPRGAAPPTIDGTQWTIPVQDITKPFIFGREDENMICPTFVPRKFGELVSNNPGSLVHFVVKRGDRHSAPAKGFSDQWLETLVTDAAIPRNRIKVFYSKSEYGLTYGEFWFVPAKKK